MSAGKIYTTHTILVFFIYIYIVMFIYNCDISHWSTTLYAHVCTCMCVCLCLCECMCVRTALVGLFVTLNFIVAFSILQCFACGAEIGPHKNDHRYQFMVSFPRFFIHEIIWKRRFLDSRVSQYLFLPYLLSLSLILMLIVIVRIPVCYR